MSESFPTAPSNPRADDETLKTIVNVINNIMRGKINATGSVTLNTGATTTKVTNIFASGNSTITFMPTTANAAADMNSMYVSDRGKQNFTITHDLNATNADRTFAYTVIG